MTDSNLPEQTNANAWLILVDEGACHERFCVSMENGVGALASIQPGDAVVIGSREASEVVAVARAYRVRRGSSLTTIYFDGHATVTPARTMAELYASPGPEAQTVSRLDWPSFEKLEDSIGMKFQQLPRFTGASSQEQAYLRELLQLAVVDDLLGPACGPTEEIVGMSVRDRYLVGKLSPSTSDQDELIEGLQGPTAVENTGGGEKAPDDLTPFEETGEGRRKGGRRVLPGEEFASATGTTDQEGDDTREVDASKNQSFVPSSLGLTVCVDGSVETLEIDARWGRYVRGDSEEQTTEDGKPLRAWKRIPSGGRISLSLKAGTIKPVAPDANSPRVLVQGTVRPPLSSGERLVTVFLVNDQPKPDQSQDEAWVFQPELTLRHPKGEAVFRRRPVIDSDAGDAERAALEMVYRRRVEFAVGHGVAVHADTSPDDTERAVEVRTRVMPEYEVAVTEAPGLDPNDRPAMRRMVDEGFLDMAQLAEMDRSSLVAALSILTDDYASWIGEQHGRIGKDVVGFDGPAKEALERCQHVLERLRQGVAVLETHDEALAAFRFANRAMADQRIRSIYALRRRRGENVDLADLDLPKNRSWRPFQLAFLLLSIPALADPAHQDRAKPVDAVADLLWFPTGGGKTEAYLGVAAFTMAIRRLQGELGGLDASRGLSVIMRYTLRLLTVQQFQRATTLICAMEVLRRTDENIWGDTPFTIGLWVGQRVTPNDTEDSHSAIEAERSGKRPTSSTPAQLTNCPWCGAEIAPGRDIEVRRFASDIGRTFIYCGDKLGRCDFSRAKSQDLGLPVLVVDDVMRLGLMAVNGQPKSTAEYIQATSRVGRFFPGLVCTVLTWSRPRDLSHYETFEHYHATFYKHVEAQSVTPFAPRALDRGLTGTMVSWLRLGNEDYNPNLGAGRMDSVSKPEVGSVKQVISQRGGRVTGISGVGSLAEAMIGERCDEWVKEATRGGRRIGYEAGRKRKKGEDDIAALLKRPGLQSWDRFTVPLSLREVEAGVRLVMNSDDLPEGPPWRVKPQKQQPGGAE